MSWLKGMRTRLRGWVLRERVDRELEEEMRWHLDMETEKYIREGMSPADARRRARIAFGGVDRYREIHREVRGMRWIERFGADLRYALGALLRSPSFTTAALLTLALGIGANTTAFGMVDALLHRPPPGVEDPEGLYRVRVMSRTVTPDGSERRQPVWTSHPEYTDLRDRTEGLSDLSAYRARNVIEGHGPDAREVRALSVSSNYFSVLRVRPAAGRFWTEDEDRRSDAVAVLAHGFWERRFGADRSVMGQTITLSGIPVTVIGVAPPHFRGIDLDPVDLWLPLGLEARLSRPDLLEARNTTWLWMVGRPAPAVSPEVAGARATETLRTVVEENPEAFWSPSSVPTIDLAPITDPFGGYGDDRPVPVWLLAVTAVVLLIACANVSGLLLARGAGRRRELAVRAALGASRGRIVQLLLVESLVLALAGGTAALALAAGSARFVHLLDIPPLDPFIDLRVVTFAFGVALATSLLVGLAPAVRVSRGDLERELKDGAPRASFDRSRIRAGLTVTQIALSIVLLVNAGLFVRSLRNVRALDPGLDPDRVAVLSLRFQRGMSPELLQDTKWGVVERLRAMPDVAFAEVTSGAPFASGLARVRLDPEPLGLPPDTDLSAIMLHVGPEYFDAVGLPVRAGRGFEPTDGPDAARVVVANAALARMLGGEGETLGRCIPMRDDCAEIVGIAENSRFFDPSEEPLPALYQSISQAPLAVTASRSRLIVRTHGPVSELTGALRRQVSAVAPDVQFVDVEPMADLLRPRLQPWRVAMIIFALAGGMAFLLAAVGLYGVIAYLVASRTHEMGVRMALGARPRRILGLVLKEGVRLSALGTGIGLILALWIARLLEHRMYGVRPSDPATYAAITLIVVAVALAATLVSARRVLAIDPAFALRSE